MVNDRVINYVFERYCFNRISQENGESIEEFVNRIKKQASFCNFEDATEMVRDRFIAGLKNDTLRMHLIHKYYSSLAEMIEDCNDLDKSVSGSVLTTEPPLRVTETPMADSLVDTSIMRTSPTNMLTTIQIKEEKIDPTLIEEPTFFETMPPVETLPRTTQFENVSNFSIRIPSVNTNPPMQ